MYALGLTERLRDPRNFSEICSDEGFTVAPMPSSIVSEQKERNKTIDVPEPEQETTTAPTFTFDMPRKTTDEAETITFYGTPTVSLPEITHRESNSGPCDNVRLGRVLVYSIVLSLSVLLCI